MKKIPETAHCVFQGVQFRIWQWDQKEFDGSTAVYELAERVPTLWVISTIDNQILIQEERQAHEPEKMFLSLSGGRAHWDEDLLLGVKRELSEETGYESNDWELLAEDHETGKILWSSYIFLARDAKKTHEPHLDAGEQVRPFLVSFEEFLELGNSSRFRGRFPAALLRELLGDENKKEEFRKKLFL